MRGVLERMARARRKPLHTLAPAQARAAYEASREGHPIAARLYAPDRSLLPVLLYFHGGGFTVGSIRTHDTLCRELACRAGCAVLSVDYRLAPEHRFPCAVHDAWDALQWVAREGGHHGLDAARLAVGGDSAGGTLAAVCAVLARDADVPLALQLLFYPGTAATQDSASHRRYREGLILEPAHLEYFFSQYVDAADRSDWRFAPLNIPDAEGLAPAWIGLAECDPLFDDGIAWGDKLRAAGVAVDLEVYRGVTHEFIKMGRILPEARQAHADAAAALRRAFGTT